MDRGKLKYYHCVLFSRTESHSNIIVKVLFRHIFVEILWMQLPCHVQKTNLKQIPQLSGSYSLSAPSSMILPGPYFSGVVLDDDLDDHLDEHQMITNSQHFDHVRISVTVFRFEKKIIVKSYTYLYSCKLHFLFCFVF